MPNMFLVPLKHVEFGKTFVLGTVPSQEKHICFYDFRFWWEYSQHVSIYLSTFRIWMGIISCDSLLRFFLFLRLFLKVRIFSTCFYSCWNMLKLFFCYLPLPFQGFVCPLYSFSKQWIFTTCFYSCEDIVNSA